MKNPALAFGQGRICFGLAMFISSVIARSVSDEAIQPLKKEWIASLRSQ
jgi:hypothetical protein